MGKNRHFEMGRTKNQNKCSVFPAAYKLDYLHTNFIFKPLTQNHQNPTKSPFFNHPPPKSQYRPQYRKTTQKSTFLPISHPHLNHQSKPLSSYISTKILRKSPFLPIANFSSKIILIKSKLTTPTFIFNST